MPPAAGGLSPRTPDLENNDACWRAKPRASRRHVFPQAGFKGAQPLWPPSILPLCFLTFTQLSLVADDCKKLLVESMNAFLEPIRDRRKALDKDPKLVWDMLEAGNAKAPRPGLAESGCAQEKAELYLLEGRKMPPAAGGSAPRPRPGKQ